ncbi:unnamed protein product [Paramecium primaurelia]|uniref:Uncharacterized protein n=1 Tax=Paramecium primaurelia TaxID=5886 RepID=A0A8S1QER7_PARPR|nr:unnamed protein product [Paramecium primaurelia]
MVVSEQMDCAFLKIKISSAQIKTGCRFECERDYFNQDQITFVPNKQLTLDINQSYDEVETDTIADSKDQLCVISDYFIVGRYLCNYLVVFQVSPILSRFL